LRFDATLRDGNSSPESAIDIGVGGGAVLVVLSGRIRVPVVIVEGQERRSIRLERSVERIAVQGVGDGFRMADRGLKMDTPFTANAVAPRNSPVLSAIQ